VESKDNEAREEGRGGFTEPHRRHSDKPAPCGSDPRFSPLGFFWAGGFGCLGRFRNRFRDPFGRIEDQKNEGKRGRRELRELEREARRRRRCFSDVRRTKEGSFFFLSFSLFPLSFFPSFFLSFPFLSQKKGLFLPFEFARDVRACEGIIRTRSSLVARRCVRDPASASCLGGFFGCWRVPQY
jgi:hypothetical protein